MEGTAVTWDLGAPLSSGVSWGPGQFAGVAHLWEEPGSVEGAADSVIQRNDHRGLGELGVMPSPVYPESRWPDLGLVGVAARPCGWQ